jgi:hypothetical protein
MEKMILIYVLENERFVGLKPITEKSRLQSAVFPNLKFKAKVVFDL